MSISATTEVKGYARITFTCIYCGERKREKGYAIRLAMTAWNTLDHQYACRSCMEDEETEQKDKDIERFQSNFRKIKWNN